MSTSTPPLPSSHATYVEKILKVAHDNNATEVRFGAGGAPSIRIDGSLKPIKANPVTANDVNTMAKALAPAGANLANFHFTSTLGDYEASLIDNGGTPVLILKPATSPEPSHEASLELAPTEDFVDNDKPVGAAVDEFAMPKVATGSIQIDKLLMAAVKNGVSDIHITTPKC